MIITFKILNEFYIVNIEQFFEINRNQSLKRYKQEAIKKEVKNFFFSIKVVNEQSERGEEIMNVKALKKL